MDSKKRMWIIAGPPGAGKTSLTQRLFPSWIGTSRYIDADDTQGFGDASDLPDGIHKRVVAVSKRLEVAELGQHSFVVESRLVSRKPLSATLRLRRRGWGVTMIYLALPKIDLCRARVRSRILKDGDDVSSEIMERSFTTSMENLPQYVDAADKWLIMDSSGVRKTQIARGSYAAAVTNQADVLRGLLPDYPFLPASKSVLADTWVDAIETEFLQLSRLQVTLDRLMNIAENIEIQRDT